MSVKTTVRPRFARVNVVSTTGVLLDVREARVAQPDELAPGLGRDHEADVRAHAVERPEVRFGAGVDVVATEIEYLIGEGRPRPGDHREVAVDRDPGREPAVSDHRVDVGGAEDVLRQVYLAGPARSRALRER
jgi:hypothetical protein